MRKYYRAAARRIEALLIKAGILATPEEDIYYGFVDVYLDDLLLEARLAGRAEAVEEMANCTDPECTLWHDI